MYLNISKWQKAFGGSEQDRGSVIQETSDGGYIVIGNTSSFGAKGFDVYVLRFDQEGNLLWQENFGKSRDDLMNAACRTSDGGYILGGWIWSFNTQTYDIYVIKNIMPIRKSQRCKRIKAPI
ncbi:MAG: hypothetical protein ACK4SU_00075 [Dictyoglomus sp.]